MTPAVQAHLSWVHLLVLLVRVGHGRVEHLDLVDRPLVRRLDGPLNPSWAQLLTRLLGQMLREGVQLQELGTVLRA